MTNETKYITVTSRYVGEDDRGNPLYESKVEDTNILEEEFYEEPYRGVKSFGFWSLGNLNRRVPGKNITLRLEVEE